MEKPSHKIAIGVATTLIATTILRFTTGFTFTGAFRWLRGVFDTCWNWAVSPVTISVWLLNLLILLSVAFIWVVVAAIVRHRGEPSSLDYTTDTFEGLVWRWSYFSSRSIRDLWCYCPSCDQVLVYAERGLSGLIYYGGGSPPETQLSCEYCAKAVAVLPGTKNSIVGRIERLIDRKIRVGEWREVVAQDKQKS